MFYVSSPGVIENETSIPLSVVVDQGGTFITTTGDTVELAAGDYEVIYALTASLATNGTSFTVTPVINSVPQTAYASTQDGTSVGAATSTIGRAFILSSDSPTTLSFLLTTDSDDGTSANSFTVTIKKIDSI